MHVGEEAVGHVGRVAKPASWQVGYKQWAAQQGKIFQTSLLLNTSRSLFSSDDKFSIFLDYRDSSNLILTSSRL